MLKELLKRNSFVYRESERDRERCHGTNLKISMLDEYKLLLSPGLRNGTEKLILMDFGLRGRYNNIAGLRVIIYFVVARIIIIVQPFRMV